MGLVRNSARSRTNWRARPQQPTPADRHPVRQQPPMYPVPRAEPTPANSRQRTTTPPTPYQSLPTPQPAPPVVATPPTQLSPNPGPHRPLTPSRLETPESTAAETARTPTVHPATPETPLPAHQRHVATMRGGEVDRRLANAESENSRPRVVRFENDRPSTSTIATRPANRARGRRCECVTRPTTVHVRRRPRLLRRQRPPVCRGSGFVEWPGPRTIYVDLPRPRRSGHLLQVRASCELSRLDESTPNFGRQYLQCSHPNPNRRCQLFTCANTPTALE